MRQINTLFQLGKAARAALDVIPVSCFDRIVIEAASTAEDLQIVVKIVEHYTPCKVSARFQSRLRRAA
jgi:hypothetical protein